MLMIEGCGFEFRSDGVLKITMRGYSVTWLMNILGRTAKWTKNHLPCTQPSQGDKSDCGNVLT